MRPDLAQFSGRDTACQHDQCAMGLPDHWLGWQRAGDKLHAPLRGPHLTWYCETNACKEVRIDRPGSSVVTSHTVWSPGQATARRRRPLALAWSLELTMTELLGPIDQLLSRCIGPVLHLVM